MSFTIVADENIPSVEQYLGALGQVVRVNGRSLTPGQLAGADILLVRSVTRVDAALLEGTPVRFVGSATSGIDHIDSEYLAHNAIAFAYAPGANANSVVEYVLAAIAAVGDTLEELLSGGRVGIVGYGNVGRALAARLRALDIAYQVYDPWLDQQMLHHAAELDAVLDCDVVSLHPELCMEQPWPSHHLLGREQLQCLRPGALLINASRGPVVDNGALLERLECANAPLVVLDVWEGEPIIDAALLARVALGTAHIAGYSLDGKLLATRLLSAAVIAHLEDARPPSSLRSVDHASREILSLLAPGELSGAGLIRFLLQARYDIRQDDALLRRAVMLARQPQEIGRAFDQLRRDYRDRRELAGSVVDTSSHEQLGVLRAMGCMPRLQGKTA
jgi:erythronate-4-phosphate dehydrogenase